MNLQENQSFKSKYNDWIVDQTFKDYVTSIEKSHILSEFELEDYPEARIQFYTIFIVIATFSLSPIG